MKRLSLVLTLAVLSHIATAGAPTLVPFKGGNATVSFPKGWVVQQENGVFAAQQDPKKKDAAGILFVDIPNANNATEDQLLDTLSAQVAKDLKVVDRQAIKGGTGHYMIADGTAEGVKVRVAAIAAVTGGQAIVSMFVAKTGDFDTLGGLALAMQVLGSLKPDAPPAPAPAAPAPAAPPAGGKLEVNAPSRALTVADLVGDWSNDDHVTSNYVSSSTGNYAGYSAIATAETWRIDAKANIFTEFNATTSSSSSGTRQVNEKSQSTLKIDPDGTLTIIKKKGQGVTKIYLIRGWAVTPDITVLKLNGPYFETSPIPDRVRKDPGYAFNLDSLWVRANPKKAK